MVAHHVAGVLAQEALDALAELLRALHVELLHAVVASLDVCWGSKRWDLTGLGVVERHVGHQVANHREGAHRGDGDGLVLFKGAHARHAQQARLTVDLS